MSLMVQEHSQCQASIFHFRCPSSDNHGDSRNEEKLLGGLRQAKSGSHVYIVGDLFDFWFEYKFAVPAAYLKTSPPCSI